MIQNVSMEFSGVTFNGSKFKMLFKLTSFDKHVEVDTVVEEQKVESQKMKNEKMKMINLVEEVNSI